MYEIFFFLQLLCADESGIGRLPIYRQFIGTNELDGVCALYPAANALCQVSKFIGC
jgi:hypothetical protein